MKVTALVVWPVSVEVDVPDETNEEEISRLLKDAAGYSLECDTIKPLIQECSIETLID